MTQIMPHLNYASFEETFYTVCLMVWTFQHFSLCMAWLSVFIFLKQFWLTILLIVNYCYFWNLWNPFTWLKTIVSAFHSKAFADICVINTNHQLALLNVIYSI